MDFIKVWLWIVVSIMLFALCHVAMSIETYTIITMYSMLDMIAMTIMLNNMLNMLNLKCFLWA